MDTGLLRDSPARIRVWYSHVKCPTRTLQHASVSHWDTASEKANAASVCGEIDQLASPEILRAPSCDLLRLSWATAVARHVCPFRGNRIFGRTELFFEPRFNVDRAKPQQPAELDAARQIATGRVAVIDCLLSQAEGGGECLGSEKVFHSVTWLYRAVT